MLQRLIARRWRFAAPLALACVAPACGGGGEGGGTDAGPAPVDAAPDAGPVDTLLATGLCVDAACAQISPGVREYEPRFPLWDDGADKRRWIYLPPGARIDTTDMSRWRFPVGTKVWKEFSRDGVRVETRYMTKLLADDAAPGAWTYATYLWTAAQSSALPVTAGVQNALGTQHDVPSRADCRACHDEVKPSRVLGFEAFQLDAAAPAGRLDLDDLIAEGLLTVAPPGAASPHFPVPWTPVETAALGYLHANCGACHNATSTVRDKTPIDLRIQVGRLSPVTATPAYATLVRQPAAIPFTEGGTTYTMLLVPDSADTSAVIGRLRSRSALRFMPNVSVELADPAAEAALRAWIAAL
jgi:hypothetical protein